MTNNTAACRGGGLALTTVASPPPFPSKIKLETGRSVSACGTRLRACLYSALLCGATEDTAIPSKPRGYQFVWDAPHHVVVRRGKRGGARPEAPSRKGGAAVILGGRRRRGVVEERG
jgi:hypothetical protein